MNMFIKMGFRNTFRNKRRSLLTSIFIGLGLASMILTEGFLLGMQENMTHTITYGLISEGQIHNPKFRNTPRVKYQIKHLPQIRQILNHDKTIRAYTERTVSTAMISTTEAMKHVLLYGIDPINEPQVTSIHKHLVQGTFALDKNSLVIGSILKKRLQAHLGDKIILTVTTDKTGEIAQALFRISGVFQTGSKDMDEGTAFIHKKRAQKLLKIGHGIHEIALKFHNRHLSEQKSNPLWIRLKETGNEAKSWIQIVSSFKSLMDILDQSKALMILILMCLVALGIINTLFMALYERMFEFAVLRALGTKSREIMLMILSEAGTLACLSVFIGWILTAICAIPMAYFGIDYGGIEFANVTFREPIYFIPQWYPLIVFPIATIVFTLIVGLYPAFYATKLKMTQAIKRSLS